MAKMMTGLASMPVEKRREIASMGGRASWRAGTAHRWTPEEASRAGRKGGAISKRRPARPKEGRL